MLGGLQKISVVSICTVALTLGCSLAAATDREDEVILPSPEGAFPQMVRVVDTSVSIDAGIVIVKYEATNAANEPLVTPLTIYAPLVRSEGVGYANSEKHFPEITVLVEGKQEKLRRDSTAYLNGKDVTSLLKKFNIDPLLVGEEAVFIPATSREGKSLYSLVQRGMFEARSGDLIPAWIAQATYAWSQRFSAKTSTLIEMKYRARPAYETLEVGSHQLRGLLSLHCAEPDRISQILKNEQGVLPNYLAVERYVISTTLAGRLSAKVRVSFNPSARSITKPLMTFVCNGEALIIGRPTLRNEEVRNRGQISILVLSRQ